MGNKAIYSPPDPPTYNHLHPKLVNIPRYPDDRFSFCIPAILIPNPN